MLEEEEVSGVLRETVYGGDSGKRSRAKAKKPKQKKPDHYDVICISLYKEDLAQLDKMVANLTFCAGVDEIDREIEKLKKFAAAGLTGIALRLYRDPAESIRLLGESVLPSLR